MEVEGSKEEQMVEVAVAAEMAEAVKAVVKRAAVATWRRGDVTTWRRDEAAQTAEEAKEERTEV